MIKKLGRCCFLRNQCCILRDLGWEPIVDVVSGGTELEPQVKTGELVRPHTFAINPTSSVLEIIVHK
jgi:hypothetical protein